MNISDLIDKHYEDQEENTRTHLGASEIGQECRRAAWYGYRWATIKEFPGRMLRLFETGNLYEPRFIHYLKSIGFQVLTKNRKTGEPIGFSDHRGHFAGTVDGVARIDGKWTLLEMKTHSDKSFLTVLAHEDVKISRPQHYSQMQVYMHYMKLETALYCAVNKNNDDLYFEFVNYDKQHAENMISRASLIIESDIPLEKLSQDKTFWKCKFCDHKAICHSNELPELNCRTCKHSTPANKGLWSCGMHEKILSRKDQIKGCKDHEYIDQLIPETISSDEFVKQCKAKMGAKLRPTTKEKQ